MIPLLSNASGISPLKELFCTYLSHSDLTFNVCSIDIKILVDPTYKDEEQDLSSHTAHAMPPSFLGTKASVQSICCSLGA